MANECEKYLIVNADEYKFLQGVRRMSAEERAKLLEKMEAELRVPELEA
ncbi:hypothetical protein [Lysobacter sp. Root494]|nr:hypothetical protein [Lysobacter sp. Root494]